jgi:hypothetical protein
MKHTLLKNNPYICSTLLALCITMYTSCRKTALPSDAVITSPVSGLIVTVAGIDYTAIPQVNATGTISDTLFFSPKIPDTIGVVKQLTLAAGAGTASLKEGDKIHFADYISPVTITATNGEAKKYFVKMVFTPPPFMYVIKTSDKDVNGVKYFLKAAMAPTIAAANYDDNYEGYIDLTSTNWDNIGLVQPNGTAYFEYNGGWWPEQSSGSFTLTSQTPLQAGYYPSAGPWADWNWANNNSAIISPGVWKVNFNATSKTLSLVETQWAITGSSSSSLQPMTYNSTGKTWSITTTLKTGNLLFTTIPVTSGDPVISYGELSATTTTGLLSTGSNGIKINEAGSYFVTIDLSKPPYYKYQVVKK